MLNINQIYYGDNLEFLKKIDDKSIDLIATDPPYGTEKNWGEYDDRYGGINNFIKFLELRCVEMNRILKNSGSFYMQCDLQSSHYIKVMLDNIFGKACFTNEIIWKRSNAHNDSTNNFGKVLDSILFYRKSKTAIFNPCYVPISKEHISKKYTSYDNHKGKFMVVGIYADSLQGGGYNYSWKGLIRNWIYPKKTLDRLFNEGRIYFTKSGEARKKIFLSESKGRTLTNNWTDMTVMSPTDSQRVGYPTQKPLSLYERIINISSNPKDTVLDPFCGSGTTLVAARNLSRNWIGIDSNISAVNLTKKRLSENFQKILV